MRFPVQVTFRKAKAKIYGKSDAYARASLRAQAKSLSAAISRIFQQAVGTPALWNPALGRLHRRARACRPSESRPAVRRLDTAKAGRSGLASVKKCRLSRRLRASNVPSDFSPPRQRTAKADTLKAAFFLLAAPTLRISLYQNH